jgi:hypothetical protein
VGVAAPVPLPIIWFWRQFGEGVDESEKISMNEDNSRFSQPAED